jgi:hypothetical protein
LADIKQVNRRQTHGREIANQSLAKVGAAVLRSQNGFGSAEGSRMSHREIAITATTSILAAALLGASAAPAEEARVIVTVPDPSKETTITIKPFAAEMSKKAAAPAELAQPINSCHLTVSRGGPSVDSDCSFD